MSCGSSCASQQTEFVISPDKAINGTDSTANVIPAMAGSSSGVVMFNVGGYTGCTTTATLQKYPDSTLFRLALRSMGKLQPIVDEKGRIFIDRDGRHFRIILNFMRTGTLVLDKDFRNFKQLLSDSEFFRLGALKEALVAVRPGIENPWSEREVIIELETNVTDPSVVKLNLPNFDHYDSKSVGDLSSHPVFSELTRLACGPGRDRLQMGAELLKLGARLITLTSANQGTHVHMLEKWQIEL